jgi:dTDP-4-dehydrorhamnose 3,5-epimerase
MPIISAAVRLSFAMAIDVRRLALDGVLELRPQRFGDDRGFFSEVWNREAMAKAGLAMDFVQDNHSYSAARGVLRGLHFQLAPAAQDKLVRVSRGAVFDVAVDIRPDSATFGKWVGVRLSAEQWNQLLVPKGFAHGFLTLTEDCEVQYKVSAPYSPERDRSLRFDDPALGIEWPDVGSDFQLSDKDRDAPLLADLEAEFG